MRATVGAVAVLGLAVAVAGAQPTKERAAALKAPQPLSPDELPLARGAAEAFPTTVSGTPVTRPVTGPAWLTADAELTPAGGVAAKSGAARPFATPPNALKDEKMPPPPKMLDRLKVFPGDGKDKAAPPTPAALPVTATPQPSPAAAAPLPTASSPFRGTGTNGAPVFAGPPAYRWYGWGSVTPGANPLAPAGQYPKASANWYQITGATPGAFPVPVTGGARTPAGVEPPTYGLAARTPAPTPAVTVAAPPPVVERPAPPRFASPPESKFAPPSSVGVIPPPSFGPPAVPVPALTPPPGPASRPAAISPTLPPPVAPAVTAPLPPAPVSPIAAPAVLPKPEPVSVLPPPVMTIPSVAPVPVVAPVPSVMPAAPVSVTPTVEPARPAAVVGTSPATLPPSMTAEPPREDARWKQSSETAPRPGTWAPANAPNPVPLPTVPPEPPVGWQTGSAKAPAVVVRAQASDNTPDPIDVLIRQLCQGRATDVEVRHTGARKIQVCFETRTSDDAKKLVSDISRRPELTSYQIDFCVLVK